MGRCEPRGHGGPYRVVAEHSEAGSSGTVGGDRGCACEAGIRDGHGSVYWARGLLKPGTLRAAAGEEKPPVEVARIMPPPPLPAECGVAEGDAVEGAAPGICVFQVTPPLVVARRVL